MGSVIVFVLSICKFAGRIRPAALGDSPDMMDFWACIHLMFLVEPVGHEPLKRFPAQVLMIHMELG